MASRVGSVIQDQNLNIRFKETSIGSKTNVSKVPRKGLGGRTPLGDLSNAVNPSSLNQASKKQNPSIFPFSEKDTTSAPQKSFDALKKRSVSTASGKAQKNGRKALSDISNSGKPNLNEGSKKSYATKLSVVAEEPIDTNAIAEERFLHNHQECIKAQSRVMDLDQFLQILGLDNETTRKREQTLSIKVKAESPSRHLEGEEIPEELIEDDLWNDKRWSTKLDSPPACKTPKSPERYIFMDYDCNFRLLDSP